MNWQKKNKLSHYLRSQLVGLLDKIGEGFNKMNWYAYSLENQLKLIFPELV